MISNILNDILKVLRGKNGTIFLIVGAAIVVLFFLKIMGPLLWLLIVGGLIFMVFKFLEKRS